MHGPKRRADPDAHFGFLDQAEGRTKKAPKRRDQADPLDLDDVWNR